MRINPTISDADKFEKNSYFENMARLKDEKPDVFDLLSKSEKLTLEIYESQKLKHQQSKETSAK